MPGAAVACWPLGQLGGTGTGKVLHVFPPLELQQNALGMEQRAGVSGNSGSAEQLGRVV